MEVRGKGSGMCGEHSEPACAPLSPHSLSLIPEHPSAVANSLSTSEPSLHRFLLEVGGTPKDLGFSCSWISAKAVQEVNLGGARVHCAISGN